MNNRVSELEVEKEELELKLQSLQEIKTQNGKTRKKASKNIFFTFLLQMVQSKEARKVKWTFDLFVLNFQCISFLFLNRYGSNFMLL